MRRLLFAVPLSLVTAFLLAGCLQAKLVETKDLTISVPWTAPETSQYVLLSRNGKEEVGRGTLEIAKGDGTYELSLKFQNGEDYDNSTTVVDATTLKPISVHRDRLVDGKHKELNATYDPTAKVVTITEVKDSSERPVPHRLKDNYYDNDSSLFLWRSIPFVVGYVNIYRTVVTGSGEQQVVHVEVKPKERIEVPAGTFDAWRVQIESRDNKQLAWYADTPEHPLVQYDNGIQLFQLTSLGQ